MRGRGTGGGRGEGGRGEGGRGGGGREGGEEGYVCVPLVIKGA